MDNLLVVQETQAFDDRIAEASDETQAESLVVVLLDQLVQIQTTEKKREEMVR